MTFVLTMQAFGNVSPDAMFAPRARRLSVETSLPGAETLMSTVLPPDLVVSILTDRLLVRTHFSLSSCTVNSVVQSMSA